MTNPRTVTWSTPGLLLGSWGEKVLMVFVLVAPLIGFTWLDSCASRPSRVLEPDDQPGSGVIVRAEVLHLWLPETLIDLVGHQSEYLVSQTHHELQPSLERRGHEKLWYASTTRGYQVNGGIVDITVIRHPYRDPEHFQEFLDVLSTVAGNPPRYPTLQYSGAGVHVLPGELSEREPSEVVEELLTRQFTPFERSQVRSSCSLEKISR
jgi:hypothetical protein